MEGGDGGQKPGPNQTAASARRCGANQATRHPNRTNPKRRRMNPKLVGVGVHELVLLFARCSSKQSKQNGRNRGEPAGRWIGFGRIERLRIPSARGESIRPSSEDQGSLPSSEGIGSGHGMDPLHSLPPPVERSAGGCGGGEDGVTDVRMISLVGDAVGLCRPTRRR